MSKLTKLILRPREFVRDAVVNAKVRAEIAARLKATSQAPVEPGADSSEVGIAQAVFRAAAETGGVFVTPSASGPDQHHCLASEIPRVLFHAVVVAEKYGRELRITAGRRTRALDRKNLMLTVKRALPAQDFILRFSAQGRREGSMRWVVWERRDWEKAYVCRSRNLYAKKVPIDVLEQVRDADLRVDLRKLYDFPIDSECRFDVDVVYTWVDHRDPDWQAAILRFKNQPDIEWDRYRSADELLYSLRSVHGFAPWARRIYVVTNCRKPGWLRETDSVRWVSHEAVFPPGADYLPTFNSHAIESCLTRIEGLSEHFVYFNDDVFLGTGTQKHDFFTSSGMSISRLEPYGMVTGEVSPEKPDYLNAAINGRKLIEQKFGVSPTQLHVHTPHSLKRSVLLEMEGLFAEDFDRVRRARFRTHRDISVVSFLYHHYAYQTRHAVRMADRSSLLVRPANSLPAFAEMLGGRRRRFFCINDGGASAVDDDFHGRAEEFLKAFYPEKAPWEVA